MLIQKQYDQLIFLKILIGKKVSMFSITEEAKETVLDFSKGTVKVL